MSHEQEQEQEQVIGARLAYQQPRLREYGTLTALTQSTTCANGYNDGTAVGCNMSFKKS